VPSLDTPVRKDLFVAGSNLLAAALMFTATTAPTWWLVAPTALTAAVLTAVADRCLAGLYLLYVAAALGTLTILWVVVDGTIPALGVFPPVILGLGVGTAANRVLFGVFRPVPDARRRRERSERSANSR
jgi:hypothetical protein